MKAPDLLLPALLLAMCTSCMSIALGVTGIYKKEAQVTSYTNNDKTVAYIPMKHIAPKEFYANVKDKVDSLQKEGYIVFLESVKETDSLTQEQKDTLDLKVRKMIGVHVSRKGYLDTVNNTLMGRKYRNRRGIVNQPKYYLLGVDTLKSRLVDVPRNLLVKEYERRYGVLELSPCDWTTPLDEKYKCGTEPASQYNSIILGYRNEHLAREIMAEPHKKIAVLYGARHENGMYSELKKLDSTWTWNYK